nr:hypothetical protein [Microbispora sp. GKU 823]
MSKPSEANCTTTSPGPRPYSRTIHETLAARLRCSTTTPFGVPVEPDV